MKPSYGTQECVHAVFHVFIILFFICHMELPIIIRLCVQDFHMVVSCVYNFVFYLSHGTPNNHSPVCEEFSHGRFMCL